MNNVICIVGPTASGKTGLSIELAKRMNAEIISADSMQIYKDLNIATAKVTKEEMQGIPHHLIDICTPEKNFSVADFKEMCYDKIQDIINRGKTPIIVGGTGLYINAIVENMNFDKQEVDYEYREFLEKLSKEKSNEYIYNMLKNIDPKSAESIHPNNVKRVIRALEIAKNSNALKSEHMLSEEIRKKENNNKFNFFVFYIDYPRDILYDRINLRVDNMVKEGLIEEVRMVYDMDLPINSTCMQAIGYKELFPFFRGEKSMQECIEDLKLSTRKYAKRQETWFKNKLNCININGQDSMEEKLSLIKTYICD